MTGIREQSLYVSSGRLAPVEKVLERVPFARHDVVQFQLNGTIVCDGELAADRRIRGELRGGHRLVIPPEYPPIL